MCTPAIVFFITALILFVYMTIINYSNTNMTSMICQVLGICFVTCILFLICHFISPWLSWLLVILWLIMVPLGYFIL